jgi:hypothetical protein
MAGVGEGEIAASIIPVSLVLPGGMLLVVVPVGAVLQDIASTAARIAAIKPYFRIKPCDEFMIYPST